MQQDPLSSPRTRTSLVSGRIFWGGRETLCLVHTIRANIPWVFGLLGGRNGYALYTVDITEAMRILSTTVAELSWGTASLALTGECVPVKVQQLERL